MFSTYDLGQFSQVLKDIRKSLNYTQNDVATHTGLSTETLRKLENGKTIPKYDTIEILSLFYKTDLHSILNLCKSSTIIFDYYSKIDWLITRVDSQEIKDTLSSFDLLKSNHLFNLIEKKELAQLEFLIDGLKHSYLYDETSLIASIQTSNELLIKALNVFIPTFSITEWEKYKYNYLELRILFAIAANLGVIRECEQSNAILEYVVNSLSYTSKAFHLENVLISKIYATMSYNYHRLDQHQLALNAANTGIEFCNRHEIMTNLPLLLCRKGVALKLLDSDGYLEYLENAIVLLTIQGNHNLAAQYKKITDNYLNA
ncbi:helix-turn-helix transcriptional regulator [Fusibacter bizertensis]|uniref:Helix-turn-helix transcriptional regulator n=1 Tax=Fusibacter bizertensis TaxID=1488331 RepID=A0ABT6NAR2_9FIRM|nr:helix-turn-helix transcriptional regulator [Fusibacter bizertensis]MDH8677513.1 helix-turn-helix transcriptional regulator [Fusibacter bizertensis]